MAITYRIGHDGRLSVQEMDNNFQYIEDELGTLGSDVSQLGIMVESLDIAGLTASVITLNTNVASATASIATLNTNVAGLTSNVAGLTASVIDLQNTFSNIDGSFHFLLLVSGVTQSGTFSFTNGILATYSLV